MAEMIMYHEATDGMLYPDLTLPETEITMMNLGRFAVRAAEYLKENHRGRYMTLVRFGKLAEKMQEVEDEANQMMEALEADYLKKNKPENPKSTIEMWNLREQAKMQAMEMVMKEIVMKFH
ncbi:TnpV protein [Acetatifactor muris]|uniref:TnpV protein n=1 Tax=Acetatifactor muris TaxID=879566 RepID=UPI0023F4199E|nr:TnpV protein [Acetatifactor muris]